MCRGAEYANSDGSKKMVSVPSSLRETYSVQSFTSPTQDCIEISIELKLEHSFDLYNYKSVSPDIYPIRYIRQRTACFF